MKTRTRSEVPRRAILVSRQAVGVEDMSRGGCRLASTRPLAAGSVGMLAVDVDGEVHAEIFRVSRTGGAGAGRACYEAAVEFLPMPAETASLRDLATQLDRVFGR